MWIYGFFNLFITVLYAFTLHACACNEICNCACFFRSSKFGCLLQRVNLLLDHIPMESLKPFLNYVMSVR